VIHHLLAFDPPNLARSASEFIGAVTPDAPTVSPLDHPFLDELLPDRIQPDNLTSPHDFSHFMSV
jgi:hypothetical protein